MSVTPTYTVDKLGRVDRSFADRLLRDCAILGVKRRQIAELIGKKASMNLKVPPRLEVMPCERLRLVRHWITMFERLIPNSGLNIVEGKIGMNDSLIEQAIAAATIDNIRQIHVQFSKLRRPIETDSIKIIIFRRYNKQSQICTTQLSPESSKQA